MNSSANQKLHIYYCGHEECPAGHGFGPARRSHYLMHFILRGCGTYQVKEKTFPVREGMAFLIHPQEITYYEADPVTPWEYIWIAFDGEEAERLLNTCQSDEEQYLYRFHDVRTVRRMLEQLIFAFPESSTNYEKLLGWFYLIWSEMERPTLPCARNPELDYLRQAKKYIRYNYSYPVQIEELARYIGIDRSYLYRIFIQHEGISPKQYLTAYRLDTAAEMLRNTALSITEIALSCGFHDSSSFCRQFRARRQITPQRFRKPETSWPTATLPISPSQSIAGTETRLQEAAQIKTKE
ncbi:MAG: AraC family transcriptional regulator [Lachnospiraceae bacterium]|nr:AraC family transcriptional regulator [Lachnospiraceae bacterium]